MNRRRNKENINGKRKANVQQRDANVQQGDANVQQRDANVQQRDANVQQRDANVQQRDANVQQRDANVQQRDANVQQRNTNVQQRDANVQQRNTNVQQRDANVQQRNTNVQQSDANVPKKLPDDGKNGNVAESVEQNAEEEHDVIDSVKDENTKNMLHLVPNRLLGHVKYLVRFENKVRCNACGMIFSNNIRDVLNHLASRDHLKKSSMKLPMYNYECEICQRKMGNERDWNRHLGSQEHNVQYQRIGERRRANLREYECLTCLFVIYGDQISIIRHKKTFGSKIDKKTANQVALKKEVKEMILNPQTTGNFATKLLKMSDDSMKNDDQVRRCLKAIVDTVKEEYPDCNIFLFGSRMSGLGDSKSDVDIFMDVGGMYMGQTKQERKEQLEIFQKVKGCLSRKPEVFIQIRPIPTARTPIIQMTYKCEGHINCDLSFTHGLSVENTKFVKFCFDLQPLARPAILVLKSWANEYYLKEEITSYAFGMMFIFYLQVEGYLLSVNKLREYTNVNPPKISCWKIIDYNRPVETIKKYVRTFKGTIFDMLKGFFEFYQDFDFDTELVCPLLGRTILINKFNFGGKGLPKEMSDYVQRVKVDYDCEFNRSSSICVQDPFDLGHNLTKKVPKPFRSKLTKLCNITYNYMCKSENIC